MISLTQLIIQRFRKQHKNEGYKIVFNNAVVKTSVNAVTAPAGWAKRRVSSAAVDYAVILKKHIVTAASDTTYIPLIREAVLLNFENQELADLSVQINFS